MPFGAADEICERARPARHSSTRGRQDLRARAGRRDLRARAGRRDLRARAADEIGKTRAVCKARVQARPEMVPATIKRHTAHFCYNLPPWIRQAQQFRQRLTRPRRIQSNGASTRSARMAGDKVSAVHVVVRVTVNMSGVANNVGHVVVPCFVSTARGATNANRVAAPVSASTARGATNANRVAAPVSASTACGATSAPIVRTYRAPWKAARNTAAVLAVPTRC